MSLIHYSMADLRTVHVADFSGVGKTKVSRALLQYKQFGLEFPSDKILGNF